MSTSMSDADVLAYLAPPELARRGAWVVAPIDTPWPPRCVKCNAPAEWRWNRTLSWTPRGVRFLAFGPGIVLYAIVATILRKKTRVSPALCPRHQQRRRLFRFVSIPFLVGGAGFSSMAVYLMETSTTDSFMATYVLAIGLVLLLSGILWLNAISRVVRLRKIEDGTAEFSGAERAFLNSLGDDS